MLKCDLDGKKEYADVEIRGNLLEITADITYIISHVYDVIKRENPLSADAFKFFMKKVTNDDSPVWNFNESGSGQEDGIKSIDIHVPKDFTGGFTGYENAE